MDSLGLLLLGLLVVLALAWLVLRGRPRKRADDEADGRLDTVAAWPPQTTRVLTTAERLAYGTLVRALPGYMVLAQVPLARFLKVPTRHSYSEWLRRLGNQCADFVICDMSSEVVAVVDVQPPADKISDRGRKRHNRMARVLKSAKIPLHVWTDSALPSVDTVRELLLPKGETAAPSAAAASATSPGPLEPDDRDDNVEVREPTPSTWFDEFNSGPAPFPNQPKSPR